MADKRILFDTNILEQIHDANIAAVAIECGIGSIATNNTDDFLNFTKYIEIISL